jgi:prophage DNA circulation protein
MSDLFGLLQTPNQIAQTIGNARTIDNSGQPWTQGEDWRLRLQPGSWRGVGFVLDMGETHAGRRVAIHEYPYRDTIWVEDLGKLPRRFEVRGFLVGDDVYSQRDAMLKACEQAGPGTLVHPTLGTVQVVLLEFVVGDRRERGRTVDVSLSFIAASALLYPGITTATAKATASAAAALGTASATDLSKTLGSFAGAIPDAAKQVTGFANQALGVVNDATRALNSVRGLVGFFGRFDSGSRTTLLSGAASVAGQLSACTSQATAVVSAVGRVASTMAAL